MPIPGCNLLALGETKEILLFFESDELGKHMATDLTIMYAKMFL